MSDSSKQPTHRVYVLCPRSNDEVFWLNIGSVWPHKDGKGFQLQLDALPLEGKLVVREIKEGEPPKPDKSKR